MTLSPDNKSEKVWVLAYNPNNGTGVLVLKDTWDTWQRAEGNAKRWVKDWQKIAEGSHEELLPLRKLMPPDMGWCE